MLEPNDTRTLEAVLRALATAAKSLRLYPASSPIPAQSLESATAALEDHFATGEPTLSLHIAREGFVWRGSVIGGTAQSAADLLDSLRDHAVAEVRLAQGCSAEDLLGFLQILQKEATTVQESGGIMAALTEAGILGIEVSEVQLTVADHALPDEGQDVDEFLKELAQDPGRLAAWFAAASAGDPATFEEGLMELVRVSGPDGFETMLRSLATAFLQQDPDAKDALLGLAMDAGSCRDLTGGMFSLLASGDIAGSVLGGRFGRNMLSLSSALTRLPLDRVTEQVRAEVQAMLPGSGHTTKEADFLDHMISVRSRTEPEAPLVESDRTYHAVAEAAELPAELIDRARTAVVGSERALTAASVRTMLTLLDQQKDFELFCSSVDAMSRIVPRLVEQGDLELAATVLAELDRREASPGSWPDLPARLREARSAATGSSTMSALVRAVVQDRALTAAAQEIIRHAGQSAVDDLVAEAISLKADGLEAVEELVGRRIVDALVHRAGAAQWYQLGPVVTRLVREPDLRSQAALESLLSRPDEPSRKEVVTALAGALGPLAVRLLGAALRDSSLEISTLAARALAKSGDSSAAALLAARLAELDIDNADFAFGRELIGALARIPGPSAEAALERLASRRSLMKRGRFAEVQDLARRALEQQRAGDRS